MVEPILSVGKGQPHDRRPVLGYSMVLAATALWGINGSMAKAALSSGLSSLRLTEVRSTGAALILVAALVATRPQSLRITRKELPFLFDRGADAVEALLTGTLEAAQNTFHALEPFA